MFAVWISLLILQRISEVLVAGRNRRWARSLGGVEYGAHQYPWIVAVHSLFFVSLACEWVYRSRTWNSAWPFWLLLSLAAQVLRLWTMLALGRFWNTRIIVIPGMKPITSGPYRYVRHPNYLALIVEMLAIPLMSRGWLTAAIFSAANGLILCFRIPLEEQALRRASATPLSERPRLFPRLPLD